jgi:hypothetical protein
LVTRNISFMHTMDQFRARTKTVTRRKGWTFLKVGDVLCAVEKGQGLKPGEKLVRLGRIKVTDVRREPLQRLLDDFDYGWAETNREGFPRSTPAQFVEFFCRTHKGCTWDSEVGNPSFNSFVVSGGRYRKHYPFFGLWGQQFITGRCLLYPQF